MKTLNINLKLAFFAIFFTVLTKTNAQNAGGEICAFALDIPVSHAQDCEQGKLENENTAIADQTALDPPCDNAGVNRDLWYSFVAPINGEVTLNIDLNTAIRIEAAVFKSCNNVSNPNTVFCYSGNADGQKISGLNAGQKYYLQLWSDEFAAGSFDFCLTTSATVNMNDECDMPTHLQVSNNASPCDPNSSGRYLEDNDGATSNFSNGIPSCGFFGEGKDVWFSFTVPASGDIDIFLSDAGGPKDWSMALYSGTCNNLQEIACDDDSGVGLFPAISMTGLTPGEVVLVRIWEYGGDDFGQFYINLINPTPIKPENDICANATDLVLVSGNADCIYYRTCGYNINGTASGEQPSPSCSEFGSGIDTWYKLAIPNTVDEVSIELFQESIEGSQDWAMSAYTGTCGNLQEIACDDDSGNGLFPLLDLTGLGGVDHIYIRVWDYASNENGSYNVCASFSGVLPVVFGDIVARPQENINIVEWSIIEDVNTKLFELESCSSKDFGNWSVIRSILPQNEPEGIAEYELIDQHPNLISYYRVRVTDYDGTIDYSKVVSVIRSSMSTPTGFEVFPNPVKDQLNIILDEISNNDRNINVEIMDLQGKILQQSKMILHASQSSIVLNVNHLSKGNMYLMNMIVDGKSYQKRFVK